MDSVSSLLFVTLTRPSFGPVHGHRAGRACRPRRPGQRTRCEHERPMWCQSTPGQDDPAKGAPLCPDCHDTPSAVLWQWHAPELWRRLTISLRRASLGTTNIYLHHLGTTADRAALERLNARGCAGGARVSLGS